MGSVAWMQLALISGAGLTGLLSCRAILRWGIVRIEQEAAAGLLEALANGSHLNGVCPRAVARARALCVSTVIPGLSRQTARSPGFGVRNEC